MKGGHPQKLGPRDTGKVCAARDHETLNFSSEYSKKLFCDTIPDTTSNEFFMPMLFSVAFRTAE